MDHIFKILSSKRHNPHHLKRYIKFIEWCKSINNVSMYTESHHICPKAKDLFPEYKSFGEFPWNLIQLTTHQHIIAHVMLWKIYGMSQVKALDAMLGEFNLNNETKMFNRKIPASIMIRYAAKIRAESQGMSTYKDSNNNRYYLHRDDPMIMELNLVGKNSGTTHNSITKLKMSKAKDYMKVVKMYFLNMRIKVRIYSDEFEQYLSQGWTTSLTKEDKDYTEYISSTKKTKKMKGRSRWAYQDGTYFDFIDSDDPRIKELDLIPHITEKGKAQKIRFAEAAVEANTDSQYYNNGMEHKKFKKDPGSPWVIGLIDWNRDAQKIAASKKRKDTFVVNDGVTNVYLRNGDSIPNGFMLGMKPQKKRKPSTIKGALVTWNNGTNNKKFPINENPGEGWVRGMVSRRV